MIVPSLQVRLGKREQKDEESTKLICVGASLSTCSLCRAMCTKHFGLRAKPQSRLLNIAFMFGLPLNLLVFPHTWNVKIKAQSTVLKSNLQLLLHTLSRSAYDEN